MKELGMTSDAVKVEHVFIFSWSPKWDKMVQKAADALLEAMRASTFLMYGASLFLALYGTAKLIEAVKGGGRGKNVEDKTNKADEKASDFLAGKEKDPGTASRLPSIV
jgi:hypothetical protein